MNYDALSMAFQPTEGISLLNFWDKMTEEGIIVCKGEDDKILYMNGLSKKFLKMTDDAPVFLQDIISEDMILRIKNGEFIIEKFERNILKLRVEYVEEIFIIVIDDLTEYEIVQKKSDEITQLNSALKAVYEQYGDDSVMVCDSFGRVEFCGEAVAVNCGVSKEYIMSKTIYELEDEKIFYPSISARVIASHTLEAAVQKTNPGGIYVTVGSPIFDAKGNLDKVVSITRDYSRQIKLAMLFAKSKDIKNVKAGQKYQDEHIITCNEEMMNLVALAKHVAQVDATVLITGETGTGKEVFTGIIVKESRRAKQPFVKVNCGAIPASIFESEMFGYEDGSFTGAKKGGKIGLLEAANHGTLFLDEIGELPQSQQVKLLQVLQEQSMTRVGGTDTISLDIRFIAATNKKLDQLVEKQVFREDLFYRLNVIPINIPPLRDRHGDIPLLLGYFIKKFNEKYGKEKHFSQDSFNALNDYHWPGNVRELENTVERLVVTTIEDYIEIGDLPKHMQVKDTGDHDILIKKLIPLREVVKDVEEKMIIMALERYGTGKNAAKALGINQSTISRKMAAHNITIK